MNKKIGQLLITLVLLGAVAFVIYDFIDKSNEQKEHQKEISGEQIVDSEGNTLQYGADVGDKLYNYELTDMQTGEISTIEDYKGKKVLMMFWASWCPHCKNQAPILQEIEEERDDIVIIGVNLEDSETDKNAPLEFIEELNLTYKNVYAPMEMHQVFQVTSTPTSIFINSEGVIEDGVLGGTTKEVIESRFETID